MMCLIGLLTLFFRNRIIGRFNIGYYIVQYKKIYSHVKFIVYLNIFNPENAFKETTEIKEDTEQFIDYRSILKINFYESQLYTNMANPVFYSKHLKFFTTEITERTEISIK